MAKVYRVFLTKSAQKHFLKICQSLPAIGRKISQAIERLKMEPHLGKKLEGSKGEVRSIRVGDYRIIYEVPETTITVMILYIVPRGGAY